MEFLNELKKNPKNKNNYRVRQYFIEDGRERFLLINYIKSMLC